MARTNGKSETGPRGLDVQHELPAPEEKAGPQEPSRTASGGDQPDELQRLKAERDNLLDRLARSQAEFENARKRAAREQREFREYALADALKSLLPTLDSFEQALQASAEKSELHAGIELIYKQLHDALAKLGLRPIPAKGETFDPHLHQAVEMVDTSEVEDHKVLEELQRGYKLKDRLLRPAMVKVARNPGQ